MENIFGIFTLYNFHFHNKHACTWYMNVQFCMYLYVISCFLHALIFFSFFQCLDSKKKKKKSDKEVSLSKTKEMVRLIHI